MCDDPCKQRRSATRANSRAESHAPEGRDGNRTIEHRAADCGSRLRFCGYTITIALIATGVGSVLLRHWEQDSAITCLAASGIVGAGFAMLTYLLYNQGGASNRRHIRVVVLAGLVLLLCVLALFGWLVVHELVKADAIQIITEGLRDAGEKGNL